MSTIYRYAVPVDGAWWRHELTGDVLAVATRHEDRVEFWAVSEQFGDAEPWQFIVVGTGHPLPPSGEYVGTAVTPSGELVWHLFRRLDQLTQPGEVVR